MGKLLKSKAIGKPVQKTSIVASQGQSTAVTPHVTPGFSKNSMLHLLLIMAVGLIAYSNTFHVPFTFDDVGQIRDNLMTRNLHNFILSLSGHDLSHLNGYLFVPRRIIGYLSFALNYRVGGTNVIGYHLVNLAIHLANGVLIYFLVLLTLSTPRMVPSPAVRDSEKMVLIALLTSLLFVAHPVQTQAVTYVMQRFASLATMFYLLSTVFYIEGRLKQQRLKERRPGEGERKYDYKFVVVYFLSIISGLLAMLTKEIAFTLPVVIILYEVIFFPSSFKKTLLVLFPLLFVLVAIPLIIVGMGQPLGELLSDLSEKTRLQTSISRWSYLVTEIRVVTTYIRLLFFPVGQNLDYDYPIYDSIFVPPVFFSFLFLVSLCGIALYLLIRSRHRRDERDPFEYGSLIGFGILWFFITVSVESSVIPIADVIFEHRVYLPSVGIFLAAGSSVVFLSERYLKRQSIVYALLGILVVVLCGATYARNSVWGNSITLWEDVVKKSPNNARASSNLAFLYLEAGRYEEAMHLSENAVRIAPNYSDAYHNLSAAYRKLGRYDDAIKVAEQAHSVNRDDAGSYKDLVYVFIDLHKFNDAIDVLKQLLKIDPYDADAHATLSFAYRNVGKYDDAIRAGEEGLRLEPESARQHNNLGLAYVGVKRYGEAMNAFQNAMRVDAKFAEAYNNLGGVYLVLGRYDEAAQTFREGLAVDRGYARSHYNLGIAYFLKGDREAAMKEYETLRGLSPAQADQLLAFISAAESPKNK